MEIHEGHFWESCFGVEQSWFGLGWSKWSLVVLKMVTFFNEGVFSSVLASFWSD